MLRHGLSREVFVVPLASNARAFLCGEENHPTWFNQSVEELFLWFRERWLLPRSSRDNRYREFDSMSYGLWNNDNFILNQEAAEQILQTVPNDNKEMGGKY